MIGTTAFCPKTGAQLSEQRYYDEHGRALCVPVSDELVDETELDGELTTGAIRSSQRALLVHFRRTHQFYRPENADLYRNVALWLRRLKQAASGLQTTDMIVWLALSARLREEKYDAAWMVGHVPLRCPRCHGHLTYDQLSSDSLYAECATNCTDDHADRLSEIEDLAAGLYAQAFACEIEEVEVLERSRARLYPLD
jgi:hypothetical protein